MPGPSAQFFTHSIPTNLPQKIKEMKDNFYLSSLYGDSVLMQQVQHGKFDEALAMGKNGAPLNRDFCGFSLLMMATLCFAPLDILKKFVALMRKNKQNMNIRCRNGGGDILSICANLVNLEKFQYFVSINSIDVSWQNQVDQMNRTVAHALFLPSIQQAQLTKQGLLSAEDFFNMINYFHDNGVLFDQTDNFGYSAADYAFIYRPDICTSETLPWLYDLVSPQVKANAENLKKTILGFWCAPEASYLAMGGKVEELQSAYAAGASLKCNTTLQTALHFVACGSGSVDCARFLIETAQQQGGVNMMQVDLNGMTALQNACNFGNSDLVSYLLDVYLGPSPNKTQINASDSYGRTLVHAVCMSLSGKTEALQTILENLKERGCDLWKTDCYGKYPIQYAHAQNPDLLPLFSPSISDFFKKQGCIHKVDQTIKYTNSENSLGAVSDPSIPFQIRKDRQIKAGTINFGATDVFLEWAQAELNERTLTPESHCAVM